MLTFIFTFILLGIAFRLTWWTISIVGRLVGGILGFVAFLVVGIFAVTILGVAIAVFPIILLIGLGSIGVLIARIV